MFRLLPPVTRGCAFFVLVFFNTFFWALPLYAIAILKLLLPTPWWRRVSERTLMGIAQLWVGDNNAILDLTQRIEWVVEGAEELERETWYIVSSNHQSWADVLVLQRVFHRRIPFLKFFIKRQLIWVPLLGLAWWALDLPFMHRHSKEYLARHPERIGEDLKTTRDACRRFTKTPTTILNFLEGTRFSPEKKARQQSPYRHLLKPKAGGIALVVDAMGDRLRSLLDVSVVYVGRSARFWDFASGRVSRVVVRVREIEIPEEFRHGDYQDDPLFRQRVQDWVAELWAVKDQWIEETGAGV